MKSIRFIFFILVLVISLIVVIFSIQSPPNPETTANKPTKYFIGAYGKGKIYKDAARKEPYLIQNTSFTDEKASIFTDKDTSAAFLFSGHHLLLLENSGIEINPKLNRCIAVEGTLKWQRVLKNDSEILIGSPDMALQLSDSGMLFTQDRQTTIYNYYSPAILSTPDMQHKIESLTHYVFKEHSLLESNPIPPGISEIDPLDGSVTILSPQDALIRFNWTTIPGISEYRFRLFGSKGMSPLHLERTVAADRLIVDLLHYDDTDHFYWDVTPFNSAKKIYGVPSKLGSIRKTGHTLNKASALLPPSLEIKALSVSGSMVLIEGTAQADSDLYIDDAPIKKDDEGRFIHTLTYTKIGQKKILFRLVSPADIETVMERTVTIFAE